MEDVLWYLLASSGGGPTRVRIVSALHERPRNENQLAEDEAPGDARGQGANDVWWVLRPDGTPVRGGQSTATGTATEDGGGGRY